MFDILSAVVYLSLVVFGLCSQMRVIADYADCLYRIIFLLDCIFVRSHTKSMYLLLYMVFYMTIFYTDMWLIHTDILYNSVIPPSLHGRFTSTLHLWLHTEAETFIVSYSHILITIEQLMDADGHFTTPGISPFTK